MKRRRRRTAAELAAYAEKYREAHAASMEPLREGTDNYPWRLGWLEGLVIAAHRASAAGDLFEVRELLEQAAVCIDVNNRTRAYKERGALASAVTPAPASTNGPPGALPGGPPVP